MKKSTSPVRRRRNGGRKPISSMNGRPGKQIFQVKRMARRRKAAQKVGSPKPTRQKAGKQCVRHPECGAKIDDLIRVHLPSLRQKEIFPFRRPSVPDRSGITIPISRKCAPGKRHTIAARSTALSEMFCQRRNSTGRSVRTIAKNKAAFHTTTMNDRSGKRPADRPIGPTTIPGRRASCPYVALFEACLAMQPSPSRKVPHAAPDESVPLKANRSNISSC